MLKNNLDFHDKISWLILFSLLLLEFFLFQQHILRNIIPYYPTSFDQNSYLNASYQLFENFRSYGIIDTFRYHFERLPQTFLFPIQTAIIFFLFGASRFSALLINFLYFAALQVISFKAIKDLTDKWFLSFIFIGLLLTTNSFFLSAGGADDFRIDFSVLCLYGIFCCSVLQSRIFLDRKWSIISTAIAILLAMTRFVAISYIATTVGFLFIVYLPSWLLLKQAKNRLEQQQRLINLLIFGIIFSIVILPLLWLYHSDIYNYYVNGHIVSTEKLMRYKEVAGNSEAGIFFYPKLFMQTHLTYRCRSLILGIFCLLGLVYLWLRCITKQRPILVLNPKVNYNVFLFLLAANILPLIILTLDISKSVIVPGVVLAPALYLIMLLYFKLYKGIASHHSKIANILIAIIALVTVSNGIYTYWHNTQQKHFHYLELRPKQEAINHMVNDIGDYAVSHQWLLITLSADKIADYIGAPISSLFYENHGILLKVNITKLGANEVIATNEADAFVELKKSNVYITDLTHYPPSDIYPFENSIRNFRSKLKAWAEHHMAVLGDYDIGGDRFRVYVKSDSSP